MFAFAFFHRPDRMVYRPWRLARHRASWVAERHFYVLLADLCTGFRYFGFKPPESSYPDSMGRARRPYAMIVDDVEISFERMLVEIFKRDRRLEAMCDIAARRQHLENMGFWPSVIDPYMREVEGRAL